MAPARVEERRGEDLTARYLALRQGTLDLTRGLTAEDQQIQSMADVSPTKWHLAHVTWFFETFLLTPHLRDYAVFDPDFAFLFNSYYEAVGERHPRPARGLLSRPGVDAILDYRAHVDAAMTRLIGQGGPDIEPLVELGLHHEQQHQELILMDIKHVFWSNPLRPVFRPEPPGPTTRAPEPLEWLDFDGGLEEIGHDPRAAEVFAFDNEGPRHKVWLEPFRLAGRLTTAGEYLAFIEDGGYARPEFWLSDGWAAVQARGWSAPLYWDCDANGGWSLFTLAGQRPLDPAEPVCHLSFYEADAFAAWAGRRLPTEAEWEVASRFAAGGGGAMAEDGRLHPAPAAGAGLRQMIGDLWQWTASAYRPYPRYRQPPGAIGEYNGKFMSGQMVLRGGAVVTPASHIRPTYRNFFPPDARWAFSGLRLADDA